MQIEGADKDRAKILVKSLYMQVLECLLRFVQGSNNILYDSLIQFLVKELFQPIKKKMFHYETNIIKDK